MTSHYSRNVPRISELLTERGFAHTVTDEELECWTITYLIDGHLVIINRHSLFADQDWMDMPIVQ